jgi:predicted transcriptional regulator of viral defense system
MKLSVERTEKQQKKAMYNAIDRNIRKGLMERVSRGVYRLTPAGIAYGEAMPFKKERP